MIAPPQSSSPSPLPQVGTSCRCSLASLSSLPYVHCHKSCGFSLSRLSGFPGLTTCSHSCNLGLLPVVLQKVVNMNIGQTIDHMHYGHHVGSKSVSTWCLGLAPVKSWFKAVWRTWSHPPISEQILMKLMMHIAALNIKLNCAIFFLNPFWCFVLSLFIV